MAIGSQNTPTKTQRDAIAQEVVFHRRGGAWQGNLDGEMLYFSDSTAGDVYEQMLKLRPNVRIGFKSHDIGPQVSVIAGDVMWMKTAAERGA